MQESAQLIKQVQDKESIQQSQQAPNTCPNYICVVILLRNPSGSSEMAPLTYILTIINFSNIKPKDSSNR